VNVTNFNGLKKLPGRICLLNARAHERGRELLRLYPRRAFALLGGALFCVVVFNSWLLSCGFTGCPTAEELRSFRPTEGGRVLDRTGAPLGRLTPVRRLNVSLQDVPVHVRQAFISTEDRRFREHSGVDWRGFIRATVRNAKALRMREGFSTITMQLARNTYVDAQPGHRSLGRKMLELRVAGLLERNLTKDQILELYLNVIYMGEGVYGVEGASLDIFGKSVKELTLGEGAVLAALPKAPSSNNPRRNPERARARRNLVLGLMVSEGYISAEKAREAAEVPVQVADEAWERGVGAEASALSAVRQMVDSIFRVTGRPAGDVVVHTTIDRVAQRAAERAVQRRAAIVQRESDAWHRRKRGSVEGAMVALDPRSGEIRAIVGATNYQRGGFNRALAAKRQPGSAFKPFVMAAAFAAGMTPATMVDDEPIEVMDSGRRWTPANYGGEYAGRVTLRRALARSANAATIRVSRAVGEAQVVSAARRNGVISPMNAIPSLALGVFEVTPLELVAAYAPFANGGVRIRPVLISRIETTDGVVVWEGQSERTPVMDPRDAWQVTSVLRSVVDEGTGHVLRDLGVTGAVAGKTGTTNEGTDVWFVGYTPTLVAGVWFGYDTPTPISGSAAGGRHAAPAWADFYRNGWTEDRRGGGWEIPDGMLSREIDPETGELATPWCFNRRVEWFKPGTEPYAYCSDHHLQEDRRRRGESLSERITRIFRRMGGG
jgi:1A family penicillin-binding protein